jgi:predicted DNA-binding transcriptional regulator YafY
MIRDEPDGSAVVQARAESIESAVAHVLSLGPGAMVLEPPEVRDGVVSAALAIAWSYQAESA